MATLRLSRTESRTWLRGRNGVSPVDIALGVVLSLFGLALVMTEPVPGGRPAPAAWLAVLAMTLPVIWRRRWPVSMALALGLGAAVNCLVIGPMVRCGPALPALLLAAYAVGRERHRLPWWAMVVGVAALIFSAALQSVSDPALDIGVLVAMAPILIGLLGAGLLVDSRAAVVVRLEERNRELRRQRARIAEMARKADRERIATDLGGWLVRGIEAIEGAAGRGTCALAGDDLVGAQDAFAAVGTAGRATLRHLREVVGSLLDGDRPPHATPTLRQLQHLGDAREALRVSVTGRPRALPPALETSGYRTLELLLDAFGERPRRPVEVRVDFGAEALELRVRGDAVSSADETSALAAARTRVALLRGTLTSSRHGAEWEAVARVPVAPGP